MQQSQWLSLDQFGGQIHEGRYSGAIGVVNAGESVIAADSLVIELLSNGVVEDGVFLTELGLPAIRLAPGTTWFAFSASAIDYDEVRLRQPTAHYEERPGEFEVVVEVVSHETGSAIDATITSSSPADVPYVLASLVWFDAGGRPVFGIFELVAGVASGGSVSFEAETTMLIDPTWTVEGSATEHHVTVVPPQPADGSLVLPAT